ncbi:type III-A CRISPR-associated protein Csm2 [Candidatus Absconditicoccus praedator]|uniref:type III-A CRISPR-associated protein Csm2 n=1 Tax=Candidatus Absconditicoccus praedator TaxID=2735562 RepID=UPI001E3CC75C|nr:type III-A CRISPR-associated protein Csm2 [Candidatus Absconditicoccus praedator]UFX83259.1 type III-A CRISPR-associated protein Csm2 [Candidatus Absconditicoccus praedator]
MIHIPGYPEKKHNNYGPKQRNKYNNDKQETVFMKQYLDNFDASDLAKSFSLESFEALGESFKKIKSNSSLRKVYDTYLDIINGGGDKDTQIQIWFAKIAYQETRKDSSIPQGFVKFLKGIYNKINDKNKFKDFLEVFVAYHKYFNPKAN